MPHVNSTSPGAVLLSELYGDTCPTLDCETVYCKLDAQDVGVGALHTVTHLADPSLYTHILDGNDQSWPTSSWIIPSWNCS